MSPSSAGSPGWQGLYKSGSCVVKRKRDVGVILLQHNEYKGTFINIQYRFD